MTRRETGSPFPTPVTALGLAAAAFLLLVLIGGAFEGSTAALAVGAALGFGGLGSLAARRVPAPADVRIGLTPFPPRAALAVLLLLPFVLVASELDNWVRAGFGAAAMAGLGEPKLPSPESALFGVLLFPVLQEFFFRGVLLQGCVASLGAVRGVLLIGLLEALLLAGGERADVASVVSSALQVFLLGSLLGFVRLATGSLLPSVALNAGIAALGVAASAFPDRVAIPGFNAPGGATPLALLAPAALAVALGMRLLWRQLAAQPPLPPIPPPAASDEEDSSPLF